MMNLVVMCIFVVCFCFLFSILILRGNGKFGCMFCCVTFVKWMFFLQFFCCEEMENLVVVFINLSFFFLQFKFCLEMAILFVICMFCCVCFVKWLFFLQFGCREEMATLVVLLFNLPVLLCHQPGVVETPKARRGWWIGWRKFDMGNSVVYLFAGGWPDVLFIICCKIWVIQVLNEAN